MTENSETRSVALDALRTVAALAVVVIHVAAIILGAKSPHPADWLIADFFHAATVWAVPGFVLISGALLLDPRRPLELWPFLARRAVRLGVPLLFWSAFYLGLNLWRRQIEPGQVPILLLYGQPSAHLWYLYLAVGLYLFIPALKPFTDQAGPAARLYFIVLTLGLAAAYQAAAAWLSLQPLPALAAFVPYFGYLVAGTHLQRGAPSRYPGIYWAAAALASAVATAIGTALLFRLSPPGFDWKVLCEQFSPTVILMALAIFIIFRRRESTAAGSAPLRLLARLSPYTLGIYCLHPAVIVLLLRAYGFLPGYLASAVIGVPFIVVAAFTISGAITFAVMQVPYLRRIMG